MVLLTGVLYAFIVQMICVPRTGSAGTYTKNVTCLKRTCQEASSPFDITRNGAVNSLKSSASYDTNPADMFRDISGNPNIKKISEVHDNGFYTSLCWIEITTITETKNGSKSAIREYAITFETPSDIPEKYISKKSEFVDGETVQYKIFDRDTRKSEVVNFTTVSKSEESVIRQNRKVLCGSGPVYTKEFMEWPNSDRKRVEIRVSPKTQNLIATDCVVLNATVEDVSSSSPTRRDFDTKHSEPPTDESSEEGYTSKKHTLGTLAPTTIKAAANEFNVYPSLPDFKNEGLTIQNIPSSASKHKVFSGKGITEADVEKQTSEPGFTKSNNNNFQSTKLPKQQIWINKSDFNGTHTTLEPPARQNTRWEFSTEEIKSKIPEEKDDKLLGTTSNLANQDTPTKFATSTKPNLKHDTTERINKESSGSVVMLVFQSTNSENHTKPYVQLHSTELTPGTEIESSTTEKPIESTDVNKISLISQTPEEITRKPTTLLKNITPDEVFYRTTSSDDNLNTNLKPLEIRSEPPLVDITRAEFDYYTDLTHENYQVTESSSSIHWRRSTKHADSALYKTKYLSGKTLTSAVTSERPQIIELASTLAEETKLKNYSDLSPNRKTDYEKLQGLEAVSSRPGRNFSDDETSEDHKGYDTIQMENESGGQTEKFKEPQLYTKNNSHIFLSSPKGIESSFLPAKIQEFSTYRSTNKYNAVDREKTRMPLITTADYYNAAYTPIETNTALGKTPKPLASAAKFKPSESVTTHPKSVTYLETNLLTTDGSIPSKLNLLPDDDPTTTEKPIMNTDKVSVKAVPTNMETKTGTLSTDVTFNTFATGESKRLKSGNVPFSKSVTKTLKTLDNTNQANAVSTNKVESTPTEKDLNSNSAQRKSQSTTADIEGKSVRSGSGKEITSNDAVWEPYSSSTPHSAVNNENFLTSGTNSQSYTKLDVSELGYTTAEKPDHSIHSAVSGHSVSDILENLSERPKNTIKYIIVGPEQITKIFSQLPQKYNSSPESLVHQTRNVSKTAVPEHTLTEQPLYLTPKSTYKNTAKGLASKNVAYQSVSTTTRTFIKPEEMTKILLYIPSNNTIISESLFGKKQFKSETPQNYLSSPKSSLQQSKINTVEDSPTPGDVTEVFTYSSDTVRAITTSDSLLNQTQLTKEDLKTHEFLATDLPSQFYNPVNEQSGGLRTKFQSTTEQAENSMEQEQNTKKGLEKPVYENAKALPMLISVNVVGGNASQDSKTTGGFSLTPEQNFTTSITSHQSLSDKFHTTAEHEGTLLDDMQAMKKDSEKPVYAESETPTELIFTNIPLGSTPHQFTASKDLSLKPAEHTLLADTHFTTSFISPQKITNKSQNAIIHTATLLGKPETTAETLETPIRGKTEKSTSTSGDFDAPENLSDQVKTTKHHFFKPEQNTDSFTTYFVTNFTGLESLPKKSHNTTKYKKIKVHEPTYTTKNDSEKSVTMKTEVPPGQNFKDIIFPVNKTQPFKTTKQFLLKPGQDRHSVDPYFTASVAVSKSLLDTSHTTSKSIVLQPVQNTHPTKIVMHPSGVYPTSDFASSENVSVQLQGISKPYNPSGILGAENSEVTSLKTLLLDQYQSTTKYVKPEENVYSKFSLKYPIDNSSVGSFTSSERLLDPYESVTKHVKSSQKTSSKAPVDYLSDIHSTVDSTSSARLLDLLQSTTQRSKATGKTYSAVHFSEFDSPKASTISNRPSNQFQSTLVHAKPELETYSELPVEQPKDGLSSGGFSSTESVLLDQYQSTIQHGILQEEVHAQRIPQHSSRISSTESFTSLEILFDQFQGTAKNIEQEQKVYSDLPFSNKNFTSSPKHSNVEQKHFSGSYSTNDFVASDSSLNFPQGTVKHVHILQSDYPTTTVFPLSSLKHSSGGYSKDRTVPAESLLNQSQNVTKNLDDFTKATGLELKEANTTSVSRIPNTDEFTDIVKSLDKPPCNNTQEKISVRVKILMEQILEKNENGKTRKQVIPVMGIEKKTEFNVKPKYRIHAVPYKKLNEGWNAFLDDLAKHFFYFNKNAVENYTELQPKRLNLNVPGHEFNDSILRPNETLHRIQRIRNSTSRCNNKQNFKNLKESTNVSLRLNKEIVPFRNKHPLDNTDKENLRKLTLTTQPERNISSDFYRFLLGSPPKRLKNGFGDAPVKIDMPTKPLLPTDEKFKIEGIKELGDLDRKPNIVFKKIQFVTPIPGYGQHSLSDLSQGASQAARWGYIPALIYQTVPKVATEIIQPDSSTHGYENDTLLSYLSTSNSSQVSLDMTASRIADDEKSVTSVSQSTVSETTSFTNDYKGIKSVNSEKTIESESKVKNGTARKLRTKKTSPTSITLTHDSNSTSFRWLNNIINQTEDFASQTNRNFVTNHSPNNLGYQEIGKSGLHAETDKSEHSTQHRFLDFKIILDGIINKLNAVLKKLSNR